MARRSPVLAPRIPVQLTQVTTADGVVLAGIMVEPKGRKNVALIWLHGLTSSFDSGQPLIEQLSVACQSMGIGYLKFNTRGHHLVTHGISSKRQPYLGATHERFRDSVKDIQAMISFARRLGYKKIILAGHSTGAQKVLYYATQTKDRNVVAVLLAGAASDIAGELSSLTGQQLLRRVAIARRRAKSQPHALVPASWGPWSNQRYVSLFAPGSIEEVFPYHELGGSWKVLRANSIPALFVSGEHDQYLTLPIQKFFELIASEARATSQLTCVAIPKADHGFHGQEKQLVTVIREWLTTVV
jgi:pimeloyl-ACP methyl ester carboxylesterase